MSDSDSKEAMLNESKNNPAALVEAAFMGIPNGNQIIGDPILRISDLMEDKRISKPSGKGLTWGICDPPKKDPVPVPPENPPPSEK